MNPPSETTKTCTHTHTRTHTYTCKPLASLCVYKKEVVPLSLSSAVLSFSNFSGVIANWCELGENLQPRHHLFKNKLEQEREKSRGGKKENGEKMEKKEKTGGRLEGGRGGSRL